MSAATGSLVLTSSSSNGSTALVERALDLSGQSATGVTISFAIVNNIASGDNFYLDTYDSSTSTWAASNFKGHDAGTGTITIAPSDSRLTSGFKIRFRIAEKNTGPITVDNVQISGGEADGTSVFALDINGIPYKDGNWLKIYEGETITIDVSNASGTVTVTPAGFSGATITPTASGSPTTSVALVGGSSFTSEVENGTMTFTDTTGDAIMLNIKALKRYPISGESLGFPTFFMTAAYDRLHNFYDSNASGKSTPYTDPDTDNFNKVIMVDSNLFPIYTALQGDQEFPNIVMRNWTSGVGVRSPSVNDYMNRSVAAAADYINYTSYLFFGYGSPRAMKAVGMRSYLQWVYVLDPANNNIRRYKFIKLADDIVPPIRDDGGLYGDVEILEAEPDEANILKCAVCNACSWYLGYGTDVLCGTNESSDCCVTDPDIPDSCFYDVTTQDKWLYMSKHPEMSCPSGTAGGSSIGYPACNIANFPPEGNDPYKVTGKPQGAPAARFPVMVPTKDIQQAGAGTVSVKFYFEGHKHDQASGLAFVANPGGGAGCEIPQVYASNADFTGTWSLADPDANMWLPENVTFTPGAFGVGNFLITGSPTCTDCTEKAYVEFSIPAACINNYYSGTYKYVNVDVYTCDKAGWVLRVPEFPENPSDKGFRIPVAGVDGVDTSGLTATEITALIEKRWGNIDAYLDVVPPESYPGYPSFTSTDLTKRHLGYGFTTNTSFSTSDYVKFNNPTDIDVYRDYFDIQNQGPVYIFVADSGNSRIQVFMNATGVAGEVGAANPIRPVPVKGPNVSDYKTNELALRPSGGGYGNGRAADWRQYTTLPSDNTFRNITAGKGEFFYPYGVAVDQDPDTKDVYLFVADTNNHRIQVFRDLSGVSSQPITSKRFDFEYVGGWGTYPLQTTQTVTAPGPYNFRYPKGLDIARFKNNSSYLYVVDSKNYRLMKYQIGDAAPGGTIGVTADAGYGYDGAKFTNDLHAVGNIGQALTANNTTPGFLEPQDVATGYSGFFIHSSLFGKGTKFLNNYMVYVTDSDRDDVSVARDNLNMRVLQLIQVPGVYSNLSGNYIPWATEDVLFGSYTSNNLVLGQSVLGLNNGVYNSTAAAGSTGSTNNVPGVAAFYTDRPAGIAALQWNTVKPIDIRVVNADGTDSGVTGATAYPPGAALPLTTPLRIGVTSRYLSFGYSETMKGAFWNFSTAGSQLVGRWDAVEAGRVHIFCYNAFGVYQDHTALPAPDYNGDATYRISLNSMACSSKGLVKIVAEDADFAYSARSGTVFYSIR